MSFDDAYEFDAPQFYNFNRTSQGCSEASSWFDAQEDIEVAALRSPLAEVTSNVQLQEGSLKKSLQKNGVQSALKSGKKSALKSGIKSAVKSVHKSANKSAHKSAQKETTKTKKRNIVTSWGDASTGKKIQMNGSASLKAPVSSKAAPVRSEPRITRSTMKKKTAAKLEAEEEHAVDVSVGRHPLFNLREEAVATAAQETTEPAAKPARTSAGGKRGRKQWQKIVDAAQAQDQATTSEIAPPAEWPALGPNRPKEAPTSQPALKLNTRSVKVRGARKPPVGIAVGSSKRTANNFAAAGGRSSSGAAGTSAPTSRLLRPIGGVKVRKGVGSAAAAKGVPARAGSSTVLMKKGILAQKIGQARSTKPLTLPDDFELQTATRAKPEEHAEGSKTPFKSLVNKIKEFQSKTPARFKPRPGPAPEHKPLCLTAAKDPVLWTTTRTRPAEFKSTMDMEVEEMASHQFKARAIGEGVPKTVYKVREKVDQWSGPTQTQPFHFVTDDRLEAKRRRLEAQLQREQEGAKQASFKAHKVNQHILDGPMGLPEKHHLSCTIPKSPLLRTRARSHPMPVLEESKYEFKAQPVPSFLDLPKGFPVVSAHVPLTQPEPFRLGTEARGKRHMEVMKAKLSEEEAAERAARNFRAHPINEGVEKLRLSHKRPEPMELTDPRPFRLRSESRHQQYVQHFSNEQQVKEELEKAEAAFKARALPRTHHVPYSIVPESDRPLTVPEDVRLTTDSRAVQREMFDREVEEKMRLIELEKQRLEIEKTREEQRERLAIRRAARFKARPMPDYSRQKPLPPPQSKPATQALTPKLGTKRRRQTNMEA